MQLALTKVVYLIDSHHLIQMLSQRVRYLIEVPFQALLEGFSSKYEIPVIPTLKHQYNR